MAAGHVMKKSSSWFKKFARWARVELETGVNSKKQGEQKRRLGWGGILYRWILKKDIANREREASNHADDQEASDRKCVFNELLSRRHKVSPDRFKASGEAMPLLGLGIRLLHYLHLRHRPVGALCRFAVFGNDGGG